MNEFYPLLETICQHPDQPFCLATVIRVEGSAYRREGAKMLFLTNGKQMGTISAGCLEEHLLYQARTVLETGRPKIDQYDLRSEDDLEWGLGAGCNGKVEILLEKIKYDQWYQQIWEQLKKGHEVSTVRSIDKGLRLALKEEGGYIGQPLKVPKDIIEKLTTFSKTASLLTVDGDFLFERYEPKDYLYIFGASPDVEPLVTLVKPFHFEPIIIDPRSSRCNLDLFPDAHSLICAHPETYLTNYRTPKNSYVLIMTHSFARDRIILTHYLNHQPKYLGILGPRQRTERLLNGLSVPNWIHSPVGIAIAAEGPDEISVSILAELIQVRNQSRRSLENCSRS